MCPTRSRVGSSHDSRERWHLVWHIACHRLAMGVRNYLTEGVSGAGKTSVCKELQRRAYQAINGDANWPIKAIRKPVNPSMASLTTPASTSGGSTSTTSNERDIPRIGAVFATPGR